MFGCARSLVCDKNRSGQVVGAFAVDGDGTPAGCREAFFQAYSKVAIGFSAVPG